MGVLILILGTTEFLSISSGTFIYLSVLMSLTNFYVGPYKPIRSPNVSILLIFTFIGK